MCIRDRAMTASRYDLSLLTNELLKASKNSVAVVILSLLVNIVIKLSAYFFVSTLLIKTDHNEAPSVNSVGALLFMLYCQKPTLALEVVEHLHPDHEHPSQTLQNL